MNRKLEDIVPCRVENIVMKDVGMQVIEHCRATCDWSNINKKSLDIGQSSNKSCR